jgi:hypothetical protein
MKRKAFHFAFVCAFASQACGDGIGRPIRGGPAEGVGGAAGASTGGVAGAGTAGAAPFARASAQVEIGYGWRLTAGAMLGAGLPRISVFFADREVASWGRPYFFVGTLGVAAPLLTWAGP